MHPTLAQAIIGVLVTISLGMTIWRLSRATDAKQRNQREMEAAEQAAIKASRDSRPPSAGS